jgi:hypothetical protein
MKVLDLECPQQHVFEGWFGSEDDFRGQLERGLVECPICGDTHVAKRLSAPRINLGAQPPKPAPASARNEVMATADPAMQAQWLQMIRHVIANTEDVGERFAEEARKIHYGESEERSIRGQASPEETEALLEEGIAVLPLPIPKAMKGPLQ